MIDRRNVAVLANHLRLPEPDARRLYVRAREVGFGAAMTERQRAYPESCCNGRTCDRCRGLKP